MACYTTITSVSNNVKKLNIMSDFSYGYIHNLYHDKQDSIDDLFCQYIKPLLKYIDHPALIQQSKQNIDATAYEKKLNE